MSENEISAFAQRIVDRLNDINKHHQISPEHAHVQADACFVTAFKSTAFKPFNHNEVSAIVAAYDAIPKGYA